MRSIHKMVSIIIALFFLFACSEKKESICNNALSNVQYFPEKMGYSLIWEDNFDGYKLDSTKWSYRQSPRRIGVFSKEALSVKDGFLNISAFTKNDTLYTGLVETKDKFMTTYGYFECRAQMQQSSGIWSAFWLQSPKISQGEDPATFGAEIDIFEFFKNYGKDLTTHAIHYAYGPNMKSKGPLISFVQGLSFDFHTYALEWTPEKYVFYIDGYPFHEETFGLSHSDEFIILSLEIPGDKEAIKQMVLPDSFLIDYVRVYKKIES
jgi:beta-glucanase (GH16 family)